jgi:hypothetical protein
VRFLLNVTEFDPSGSHLIALHQSGAGIMWDVDPQLWERRACTVAGRTLTLGWLSRPVPDGVSRHVIETTHGLSAPWDDGAFRIQGS